MPFPVTIDIEDVRQALTDQGYTVARAGRLDNLDATVSSRAAPGAAMDLTPGAEGKVRAQVDGEFTERGYTAPRAANLDNLDISVSSRAAPGAAMDLVAAARAAIWNELIPAVPAAGSYGERINANLDISVGSRASPADVGAELDGRGVSAARMARLDSISEPVRAFDAVTAAANTAGLTVSLDTGFRSVLEVRYTSGGPADFFVEGSDDNVTWWLGYSFSEPAGVTDKIKGFLTARRFVRMRSPTTGIDLNFELVSLL